MYNSNWKILNLKFKLNYKKHFKNPIIRILDAKRTLLQ